MQDFAESTKTLKLTLSDKGQLVSSDPRLGAKLARTLQRQGLPVTHVYQARDLGLINAAGKPVRRLAAGNRISQYSH